MNSSDLHIGQAARVLGVTPNRLRKLERAGRIPPVGRDFSGRVYSPSDIALLRGLGVSRRPQRLKTFEVVGDG